MGEIKTKRDRHKEMTGEVLCTHYHYVNNDPGHREGRDRGGGWMKRERGKRENVE